MPLLPDGSEKGLRGYAEERGVRARIGMAPAAGEIDRNPPDKRIATEEAWTFPELVKAQFHYLNAPDKPNDESLIPPVTKKPTRFYATRGQAGG